MAPPSVPCTPPTELVAGSSAVWDDAGASHPDYGSFTPADGWTLTYAFVGPDSRLEVTAAVEGSGWRTSLTQAQTTELQDPDTPGDQTVRWTAWVSKATDRFPVAQGVIAISADPTQQTAGFVSETATELKAAKAARARGLVAYSLGNRSFNYGTAAELDRRIARLTFALWQEQHPGELAPAIAGVFR